MAQYAVVVAVALTFSVGSAAGVGLVYKNVVKSQNDDPSEVVQTSAQPPEQSFVVVGAPKGDVESFTDTWTGEDTTSCKGADNSWKCKGGANVSKTNQASILGSSAETYLWRGDSQDEYYAPNRFNRFDQIGWSWEIPQPEPFQISTTRRAQTLSAPSQAAQSGAGGQGQPANQSPAAAQSAAATSAPDLQVNDVHGPVVEIKVVPSSLSALTLRCSRSRQTSSSRLTSHPDGLLTQTDPVTPTDAVTPTDLVTPTDPVTPTDLVTPTDPVTPTDLVTSDGPRHLRRTSSPRRTSLPRRTPLRRCP